MQPTLPPEECLPDVHEPEPKPPQSKWLTIVVPVIGIVITVVAVAGYFIQLPYYTVSPGEALDVNERIEIDGTDSYTPGGDLLLLFVRQSGDVNAWQWLWASFDPDTDLVKEEQFTRGETVEELRTESDADMALAQLAAKKLALEIAGYEVPAADGVVVLGVYPSLPAGDVLEPGDLVLAADDQPIVESPDLGGIVRAHEPGETLSLQIDRDGRLQTVEVGVGTDDEGNPVIGVLVAPRYDFPIDISIDTSSIGGPSAGLAMTLSIIDTLTPGELTGGKTIAVTGTIRDDGTVGEIGGLHQKTVAARAADADLFIVPKCADESAASACMQDLERARDRADGLELVPVATLDEALEALARVGGDPVETTGDQG